MISGGVRVLQNGIMSLELSHYFHLITNPNPKRFRFYDLRLSETRELQAKFAKESGIDAFYLLALLVW